jgi:hypothetical protein
MRLQLLSPLLFDLLVNLKDSLVVLLDHLDLLEVAFDSWLAREHEVFKVESGLHEEEEWKLDAHWERVLRQRVVNQVLR